MKISKIIDIKKDKRVGLITTAIVMIVCLFLSASFPSENSFQTIVVNLIFLVILPAIYIKLILRRKFAEFGLQKGSSNKGIIWMIVSFMFLSLFLYGAINYTRIAEDYWIMRFLKKNFLAFLIYQLSGGVILAMVEFFFRGFVMHYFYDMFAKKYFAVIFQFLVFTVFIWSTGALKFNWIVMVQVFLAFFSGIIAYKSKSILYSYLFALISNVVLGTVIIKMSYLN
ncbi:hypothetical protein ACFL08_04620 [Patescibacteria group bacterium]